MPSNRSYGGLSYDSEAATPYHSTEGQLAKLAVAVAGGTGAMYMATRTRPMSMFRPIDYVAGASRYGGNLSPFQLLNTFRIPDIVSPFTSMQYKSLGKKSQEGISYWTGEYLQSGSTYDWIQKTTGKSAKELEQAGITRGMVGPAQKKADAIIFEQGADSISGKLYSVMGGGVEGGRYVGGTRTLLSSDIVLQSMGQEVTNVLTGKTGINRIAAGLFAAADMYTGGFNENEVFAGKYFDPDTGQYVSKRATFMPAPSPTGQLRNFGDVGRRTNLIRGLAAFGMDRFNRLVDGAAEQLFGEKGGKAVSSILGTGAGVRPGPASAMFARFGTKAGLAGAALMGFSQVDWARRQFGMPGQIGASGLMSLGLGLAARKFGAGPRKSLYLAAGSFFGQMLLPGFDQGVMEGIATTAVNVDIARATAINPFNYYRRTVEGFLPGVSDWQTGALLGVGGILATSVKVPGTGVSFSNYLLKSKGPQALGLNMPAESVDQVINASRSVRDIFYREVSHHMGEGMAHTSFSDRRKMMSRIRSDYSGDTLKMNQELNALFAQSEEQLKKYKKDNPMTEALKSRLKDISAEYADNANPLQRFQMEVRGLGAQAYYSFFGANLNSSKSMRRHIGDMGFKVAGRWGKWASIFGGVLATQQVLTGGLLGSKETADDLRDIYSGKKHVAVKSSRYWEAGGTPFEGGETSYYRPHQYHLMMNRVRERGIYGDDEDSISPIGKFFKKNFTYELEMENYYSRPYPISAPAFADVPIIGGALAATIGQIVKPARVMHAGEFIQPGAGGEINYGEIYKGSRMEPAHSLGMGHGVPYNPYSATNQLGYLSYQFRELEGMTGWAKNTAQKLLTGESSFTPDGKMLADSSLMTSSRVRFWEAQMGGAFFTNEFLRRILPSYRAEIDRTNPIANSMPSWMPDKFKYGDPYRSVEWGEARLPGSGYAALHPELKGLDPEAYPLLYKYAILSDVAPLSHEYNMAKKQIYQARMDGTYNANEIRFMEEVDRRHAEQVSGFSEDRMHERAIRLPGSSLTRSAYARGQEFARSAVAPAEYLVPMGFRPMQKLMSDRGMIEQYEYERMYGTPLAFWDKPWRDWLRPAMYSSLNMMGYEGKPVWRAQADAANAYFDQLEFMKYAQLKEQAELAGDGAAARSYRYMQASTRAGVNPQGSPLGIYWTLPEAERKFFNAFAHASGKDRHRIEEMIPEDQVHLYRAVWSRMDAGDQSLFAGADSAISDAYLAQREAEVARGLEGQPQPGVDWIGWHEDVDMQDIKVRYINQLGAELSDYGAWNKQLKKSMQQPILEGSSDFIFQQGGAGTLGMGIRNDINRMSGSVGARGNWQATPWRGTMSSVQMQLNDNRQSDVSAALERYLGGY